MDTTETGRVCTWCHTFKTWSEYYSPPHPSCRACRQAAARADYAALRAAGIYKKRSVRQVEPAPAPQPDPVKILAAVRRYAPHWKPSHTTPQ